MLQLPTNDGKFCGIGSQIWVICSDDWSVSSHFVDNIKNKCFIYKKPDHLGCIGTRCDWAYSTEIAAQFDLENKKNKFG